MSWEDNPEDTSHIEIYGRDGMSYTAALSYDMLERIKEAMETAVGIFEVDTPWGTQYEMRRDHVIGYGVVRPETSKKRKEFWQQHERNTKVPDFL